MAYLLEIAAYSACVFVYFFLTLHFFGDWLKRLYDHDKLLYGLTALGLITGQGLVLESLTTALARLFRGKPK
ncbi:MAG TPA: hypothetical protein VF988_06050 [Verrucomicrobiae bacterium]